MKLHNASLGPYTHKSKGILNFCRRSSNVFVEAPQMRQKINQPHAQPSKHKNKINSQYM